MTQPLAGQVALVAGATRAAGRGIAVELAAAGARVWCTGRSTRSAPATPGRPETIEETAELIAAAGGEAVAVRVDHTVGAEVEALALRVRADEGRLDILVNDIWGGDELIDWGARFWAIDIAKARDVFDQAVFSHLITSRHLAPLMVEAGRGLIVEVTDGEFTGYRGQLLYDLVKASVNRLAYAMAWDLVGTGVTALAVSPGFLRSEAMLDRFGVAEANWRDGVKVDAAFAFSETPRYVGRAIAALAADPAVGSKAGLALFADDLAGEYGFDDLDGSRPHFWRNVEAGLERELAKSGELDPPVKWTLAARYRHLHLTPSRAEQMRAYAARLGFGDLGAGLSPVGG
ncbi:MAG TPA: SDR family oxidoreductase [Caulobacteraceae bacterium]|jgi:NAD(P)-dependent dehydrogenase (short-subunit alcohol dehydrogenase family)|nr:SDR family oxidoreductase [Caulobacteraceae bacterium]